MSAALSRYRATRRSLQRFDRSAHGRQRLALWLAPVPMFYHPRSRAHPALLAARARARRTARRNASMPAACSGRYWRAHRRRGEGGHPVFTRRDEHRVDRAAGDRAQATIAARRSTTFPAAAMSCTAWKRRSGAPDHRSFAAAILRAANLGDDADTTAAVCGQIAGAHYGESGIPAHWLERLTMRRDREPCDLFGRPVCARMHAAAQASRMASTSRR